MLWMFERHCTLELITLLDQLTDSVSCCIIYKHTILTLSWGVEGGGGGWRALHPPQPPSCTNILHCSIVCTMENAIKTSQFL